MKGIRICGLAFALVAGLVTAIPALQSSPEDSERIVVPLTDPARPARLVVEIMAGSITVHAGTGKDITVQAAARSSGAGESEEWYTDPDEDSGDEEDKANRERKKDRTAGLRRIPNTSTGLEIVEENNSVHVETSSFSRPVDLVISVPARTSLKLGTVNDGDIRVDGVDGEIEVENTNGHVTLEKVSGSVVAHALNGHVTVDLVRIETGKAMSFSSMNGDLDVTFPATLKADLRLKADNGEIFTDFEVNMRRGSSGSSSSSSSGEETPEPKAKKGSKKTKIYGQDNQGMHGTVNGGGPTMRFETFNGNIYIRKRK
jgi:hypothetical protein